MNPIKIKQIRDTYETAKTFIGLPEAAGYSAHYWNDVPNLLQEIEHQKNEVEVWKASTHTASGTIERLRETIVQKDKIITSYMRIEQDLMDDCTIFNNRYELLRDFLIMLKRDPLLPEKLREVVQRVLEESVDD